MERRDDPGGNRAAKAERIADGDRPIADAHGLRIAELDVRQVGRFDLQQRHVGQWVAADQLGLVFAAIGQRHGDLVDSGTLAFTGRNHMVVGDDIARRIDDEARAERRRFARHRLAGFALLLLEAAEQLFERRRRRAAPHLADFDLLRRRNVDDSRGEPRGQIGKAARCTARRHDRHRRGDGILRRRRSKDRGSRDGGWRLRQRGDKDKGSATQNQGGGNKAASNTHGQRHLSKFSVGNDVHRETIASRDRTGDLKQQQHDRAYAGDDTNPR